MDSRAVLLSVRPRFAQAILEGTKTVELRRRPMRIDSGWRVIIYETAPTMAVVGVARVAWTQVCQPSIAWKQHGPLLGLSRSEFDEYLGGRMASLLTLEEVAALPVPLSLHQLRSDGRFDPPQSYRFVSPTDPAPVRALAHATARSSHD